VELSLADLVRPIGLSQLVLQKLNCSKDSQFVPVQIEGQHDIAGIE
jgi:hypothetical protein